MISLNKVLHINPLIAILRGITPDRVIPVSEILINLGFICIEIPLNSPKPLDSIKKLANQFDKQILVGAGTVIDVALVEQVKDAGAGLVVMPHSDPAIIQATKKAGLICVPGFSTATEAWQAIHAKADALKFFPANILSPNMLRAIKTIIPPNVPIIPTGGITTKNMKDFLDVGVKGFGLGSELFRPDFSDDEIYKRALEFMQAAERDHILH